MDYTTEYDFLEELTKANLGDLSGEREEEFLPTNKKTMNIFEEIEHKEFTEGKEVKAIAKKIKEARGVADKFSAVANRISQLAQDIDWDVDSLGYYADEKEIGALKELANLVTSKLEIFEDKKVISSIETLATIFKIENGNEVISKKELTKALGL